jgi:hypothetical protein
MSTRFQSLFTAGVLLALTAVSLRATGEHPARGSPAPAWSQGDAVREGAAEFMILMEIARLQKTSAKSGLVGVGDRRGLFGPGAEEALHRAVLQGVPVVKLATGGRVLRAPHGLFIDGQDLSEQEAAAVLARCRAKHGDLPAVGESAADHELARLREHLRRYQDEFTLAAGTRLAVR